MGQKTLVQITKEDGTNVLLPSNEDQVQLVRNNAAKQSGKYYAYFSDGTREEIGGSGNQIDVVISYDEPSRLLSTVVTGGVAPYTYEWIVQSFAEIAGSTVVLDAPLNESSVTVNDPGSNTIGLTRVKVTDSKGYIGYGYFSLAVSTNNP